MEDNCSYFIFNKGLFGPYPTQRDVDYMETHMNVRLFVDLTEMGKLPPYIVGPHSIALKYPIPDMRYPYDAVSFCAFVRHVEHLISQLQPNEKIYCHCRGGNGRVGILVAVLLARHHKITALEALQLTTKYHSERRNLKAKYKVTGSPQTNGQRNFVTKLLTPFCFSRAVNSGHKFGLVPYTRITFDIPYRGSFTSVMSTCGYNDNDSWLEDIETAYRHVILQYPQIRQNLLKTTIRPLIYCHGNTYLGVDGYAKGANIVGRILEKIRDELLLSY